MRIFLPVTSRRERPYGIPSGETAQIEVQRHPNITTDRFSCDQSSPSDFLVTKLIVGGFLVVGERGPVPASRWNPSAITKDPPFPGAIDTPSLVAVKNVSSHAAHFDGAFEGEDSSR